MKSLADLKDEFLTWAGMSSKERDLVAEEILRSHKANFAVQQNILNDFIDKFPGDEPIDITPIR